MAKGIKTGGRQPGVKNKPEENLLKNYTHSWLLKWGQSGFDAWATKNPGEALKIAVAFAPKNVEETTGPVSVSVNFTKA